MKHRSRRRLRAAVLAFVCLAAPGLLPGAPLARASESVALGESCSSTDPSRACLSVQYVAYRDPAGVPGLEAAEAMRNIRDANALWAPCRIAFQIDAFAAVAPAALGLPFGPGTQEELDQLRSRLAQAGRLLVVVTGSFAPGGWIGGGPGGAQAWTKLPPSYPPVYGSVIDRAASRSGRLLAHELGHYLALPHSPSASNLMAAMVGDAARALTESQCEAARAAVREHWAAMLR